MSTSKKDNNLRGARNIGILGGSKRVNGFVGKKDKLDFAQFSLSGVSDFGLTLGGIKGQSKSGVRVTLRDGSGSVFQSFQSGSKPKTFSSQLGAGTYYVGVQRLKGEVRYKLTTAATPAVVIPPSPIPPTPPIPPAPVPDTLATALDIGALTGTYLNSDFVGTTDSIDFYKFSTSDVGNLQVRINGTSANTKIQLIRDGNGNGLIDAGEILASDIGFSTTVLPSITQDLPAGTYFVSVEPSSSTASTQYQISLVNTPFGGSAAPDPGNTLPTARDLGIVSGTVIAKEYVGKLDPSDIYRFTLNDLSNVQVVAKGTSDSTRIQLIRDSNNNGLIDNDEILDSDNFASSLVTNITQDLPAGAYFIKVDPRNGNSDISTLYELNLVTTPFGGNGALDPGNTLSTARDLGVLSGTATAKEYVGIVDPDDFYKFTLNSAATLQAKATGSSDSTRIQLIRDINGNGLIDNNEILASDNFASAGFLTEITQSLQAGAYFIRVDPRNGNTSNSTNYSLSLTI